MVFGLHHPIIGSNECLTRTIWEGCSSYKAKAGWSHIEIGMPIGPLPGEHSFLWNSENDMELPITSYRLHPRIIEIISNVSCSDFSARPWWEFNAALLIWRWSIPSYMTDASSTSARQLELNDSCCESIQPPNTSGFFSQISLIGFCQILLTATIF